jgi:glycosyltransferase involved in cell wall biosynthesis
VHAAAPAARAIVVGEGPEHDRLEATSRDLGLRSVVTFAGHRTNPVDEMNAADVVALSSRWEGSPLVIAEYLAVGTPLVTTAVGTVTRHLTDGVGARVVPVGDHRALAAAIVDLLRDPGAAARIGAAGHRIGQTVFDADALVDGVEAVYSKVTS